jgi:hypothetical protein
LFSYPLIPILFLLILPCIGIVSEFYYIETNLNYPVLLKYFEFSLVIAIAIYILLPYLFHQKYFNINSEYLVREYELLKKLMYVGVPLLIIVMLFFVKTFNPEKPNFSLVLFSGLILVVSATFFKMLINLSLKNFRYYYAKGCFQILTRRSDKEEMMKFLVMGINSYNKFLKRNLKLQINNIHNLYSKIISNFIFMNSLFVNSLSKTFQNEDKLLPLRLILHFSNLAEEQFLIQESLWEKIKEWATFLVAIIPVTISIIQFLLTLNSK